MTLCSTNKANLHFSTKYSDFDPYRTFLETETTFLFPSSKLLIKSAETYSVYYEIMKTGIFKIEVCKSASTALNWGS